MSYDKIGIKRLIVLFLSVPLISLGLFSCNKAEEESTPQAQVSNQALAPAAHVDKTWPSSVQAGEPHIAYYNTLQPSGTQMSAWISQTGTEKVEAIQSVAVNSDASKVYIPAQVGVFVVDTRTGSMSMFHDFDEKIHTTHGIEVADNGDVYVVFSPYKIDNVNYPGQVKVFNSAGEHLRTFGEFDGPSAIALDNQRQRAYIVEPALNKISAWGMSDTGTTNSVGIVLKTEGAKYTDSSINMVLPIDVAVNSEGYVYVVNWGKHKVMIYNPTDGKFEASFGQQGIWPSQFTNPKGIAIDGDDNVYVTDAAFDNLQVFVRDANKTDDTQYDHQLAIYLGKAGNGIGEFNLPSQIAIDNQNRIYVAEYGSHRIQIFQYLKGE